LANSRVASHNKNAIGNILALLRQGFFELSRKRMDRLTLKRGN